MVTACGNTGTTALTRDTLASYIHEKAVMCNKEDKAPAN